MGVLEFLCDRRFHQSFVLPPDPAVGRDKPYRCSYADFGDAHSNAVVLFCGALMGTRLCYAPLDQLARTYNVRIIHPDRPGIGGSDPVELEKRIQIWLEIVPQLLTHLNIRCVSLASHSGGDIYLLNTLITYPHLLHPQRPYVTFFAPWVHPSHSNVTQMRATELLPAPMIGKFANIAKFVNDNVMPMTDFSTNLIQGLKTSRTSSRAPAPVPLDPTLPQPHISSAISNEDPHSLALDNPEVVEKLRGFITMYVFAERMEGISSDAQLFMRKPRSISWCSPSIEWSDIDYFVPFFSKLINEDVRVMSHDRTWTIDAFHAESDNMVGEKGRRWFDDCWQPGETTTSTSGSTATRTAHQPFDKRYDYRSTVFEGTDHNFLMDPRFGVSELWLQRVRDSFQPSASEPTE